MIGEEVDEAAEVDLEFMVHRPIGPLGRRVKFKVKDYGAEETRAQAW